MITNLPNEIILQIIYHLNTRDILSLRTTCTIMLDICSDYHIWKPRVAILNYCPPKDLCLDNFPWHFILTILEKSFRIPRKTMNEIVMESPWENLIIVWNYGREKWSLTELRLGFQSNNPKIIEYIVYTHYQALLDEVSRVRSREKYDPEHNCRKSLYPLIYAIKEILYEDNHQIFMMIVEYFVDAVLHNEKLVHLFFYYFLGYAIKRSPLSALYLMDHPTQSVNMAGFETLIRGLIRKGKYYHLFILKESKRFHIGRLLRNYIVSNIRDVKLLLQLGVDIETIILNLIKYSYMCNDWDERRLLIKKIKKTYYKDLSFVEKIPKSSDGCSARYHQFLQDLIRDGLSYQLVDTFVASSI